MHTTQRNRPIPSKPSGAYAPPVRKGKRAHCFSCDALYDKGRWQWRGDQLAIGKRTVCPACKRIQNGDAAGRVLLHGPFYLAHRSDIDNLIRNVESAEKAEHPLERIMYRNQTRMGTEILTTGTRLAKRIAEAVRSAYKGDLTYRHSSPTQVRAYWTRDIVDPV